MIPRPVGRRRSDVAPVPPLRPLSLNRATSEMASSTKGTLFLKVIEGTDLVQATPQVPERKLQARFTAFLNDSRGMGLASAATGAVAHAVNVVATLMEGGDGVVSSDGFPGTSPSKDDGSEGEQSVSSKT
ncbi:unnamed protein product, partial [Discosporangium mesarthrocarpum]